MQSTTSTPILSIGSQGSVVRELQTLLNQNVSRDYSIVVDGIFGSKTEAVVKLCQGLYFLEKDGIVGPKTWKALRAKQPVDLPILGRGSQGALVRRVQEVLNMGTSFNLVLDGIFGPKTEAAVKQIQSSSAIEVDRSGQPIVGPKTWIALSGKLAFFTFD